MEKLISLFLSLALVFSLAACGSGNADTSPDNEPAANTTEATPDDGSTDAGESDSQNSNVLVVYYSGSGHTARVATDIAEAAGADLFEITPVEPYSSDDLDYTNDSSRVVQEYNDESLRDVALTTTTVENWDDYDTVFIGYPIWWAIAAWPVNNFVKENDFTGKTVVPFATSASSGMGRSGELLEQMAGTGIWQTGRRFASGAAATDIYAWAESLDL